MVKKLKENLSSSNRLVNKVYSVSGHNEVREQVSRARSAKVANATGVLHNALPTKKVLKVVR